MRIYIVWVKGIRVTLKIPAVSVFRKSSRKLAKSRDYSRNTLTLQLPTCAPHVTSTVLIKASSLKTKPITIKSHKI